MKKLFSAMVLLTLMTQFSTYVLGCTGVIVGKGLTTDGSFIFGRNEDFLDTPEHNKNFVVHERGKNKPGTVFKDASNGFTYTLPEERFKYFSVPDVTPEEGIFDEAGYNEYGVAIDTTVSADSNDKIKKIDPYVKDGIAESAMPTVILPYVKTAREGVLRLAEIIKTKGAAEGNILVIADKKEMWYIEIYSGHQFVAVKYPDDKFSVFPNTFFLGTVDLNDKNNVIKSDGIEKVAKDAGSYVAVNGKMHLAKSYAPEFAERNRSRAYSGILQINPKAKINYNDDRFEFFQSSDKKISLQDVMGVLRNRLENTKFKPQMDGKKGDDYKYPINNENVIESHIFQIKKDLPANVGGIMWLTMASSKYSPYIPYYGNINATYDAYHVKGGKYDANSFYWVSETVNTAMNKASVNAQKEFFNKIKDYENKKIAEQNELNKKIAKMSPKEAEKFATDLALKNGKEAFEFVKAQEKLLKK
jgi:putative dipeptidase B